jgi:AraC-like DNA-binding protein
VALACGFFDQSHLNRVFKARMGVTPGVYRAA